MTTLGTLSIKKTGNGHYEISIFDNGERFTTVTTNMMAIDAAFDECYDDEDNSQRVYESREQAMVTLISEIVKANNL